MANWRTRHRKAREWCAETERSYVSYDQLNRLMPRTRCNLSDAKQFIVYLGLKCTVVMDALGKTLGYFDKDLSTITISDGTWHTVIHEATHADRYRRGFTKPPYHGNGFLADERKMIERWKKWMEGNQNA